MIKKTKGIICLICVFMLLATSIVPAMAVGCFFSIFSSPGSPRSSITPVGFAFFMCHMYCYGNVALTTVVKEIIQKGIINIQVCHKFPYTYSTTFFVIFNKLRKISFRTVFTHSWIYVTKPIEGV